MAWVLGSLMPATACVLLTFSVFNSENRGVLLHRAPMTAMVLSNQNYAAYAADNFRETQNGLSAVTFDWTNRSNFNSSIAPFSPDATN